MLTSFVISLREGLEAVLIVTIVLSFLAKTGAQAGKRYVWYGVAGALTLCLTAGVLLFSLAESLAAEAGEVFEISVTLLAVAALTFMILWMKRKGRSFKSELEARARQASAGGRGSSSALAMVLLAFTAVSREGFETVLLLLGNANAAGATSTVVGAGAGFAVAVALGFSLYRGVYRLNLKKFFDVTGVILIVFAAGLIGNVFQEIAGSGFVPSLLTITVWNSSSWLSQEEGVGALLHSLFGYQSEPSVLAIMAYGLYLVAMLRLFFRQGARQLRPVREGA